METSRIISSHIEVNSARIPELINWPSILDYLANPWNLLPEFHETPDFIDLTKHVMPTDFLNEVESPKTRKAVINFILAEANNLSETNKSALTHLFVLRFLKERYPHEFSGMQNRLLIYAYKYCKVVLDCIVKEKPNLHYRLLDELQKLVSLDRFFARFSRLSAIWFEAAFKVYFKLDYFAVFHILICLLYEAIGEDKMIQIIDKTLSQSSKEYFGYVEKLLKDKYIIDSEDPLQVSNYVDLFRFGETFPNKVIHRLYLKYFAQRGFVLSLPLSDVEMIDLVDNFNRKSIYLD